MGSQNREIAILSALTEDGSIQFFSSKLAEALEIPQISVPERELPILQMNFRLHWTIPKFLHTLEEDYEKIILPSHTLLSGVKPGNYSADLIPIVHDLERLMNRDGNLIQKFNIRKSVEKLESCEKVIAISELTKNDILEQTGVDSTRVKVVKQGVDPQRIYADPKKPSIDLPEEYVLYLGALQERKNPKFLIDVLKELPEEYNLVIAGRGYSESNKERLESYIEEEGQEDRVIFTGFLSMDDLRRVYTNASVYLHSAIYEGYGRTPVEAATCGTKPIIYEDIPCVSDLKGVAETFEEFDPEEVANMVQKVSGKKVEYSPRKWSETAKNLREAI